MSSQLASQLQILSGGKGKAATRDTRFRTKKPSFLFEPNVAADTDNQTVYELGINGFAELRKMDERFAVFEGTLFDFSGNAVVFDRAAQTAGVNERIDESISAFFRIFSPYFLLKPAHKVLEYMIRRFAIQDNNVDSVLESILPFHQTTLFGRMLQLLKLTDVKWEFLKDAQKSGSPIARETLVQRCIGDHSILQFVCEIAKKVTQIARAPAQHKIALTLYTVTTIEVLEAVKQVPEQLILTLLPYIIDGLKAKACPDYQIASYMIVTELFNRALVSAKVLNSVIIHILKSVPKDTSVLSLCRPLLPIVSIFQTQSVKSISSKALKRIMKLQHFSEGVREMCREYDMESFLSIILKSLISNLCSSDGNSKYAAFLESFTMTVPVHAHVPTIVSSLLEAHLDAEMTAKQKSLRRLLLHIETHYPNQMEKTIGNQLKIALSEGANSRHQQLLDLVTSSFRGTQHEIMEQSGTTLFLSLEHPIAAVRVAAVEKFENFLQKGMIAPSQASEMLLNRLQDKDNDVVKRVLAIENLAIIIESTSLLDHFLQLLDRQVSSQETTILTLVLRHVGRILENNEDSEMLAIKATPFFLHYLVATKRSAAVNAAVLNLLPGLSKSCPNTLFDLLFADLAQTKGLAKLVKAGTQNKYDCDAANTLIVSNMAAQLCKNPSRVCTALEDLPQKLTDLSSSLILCVLTTGLTQMKGRQKSTVSKRVFELIKRQWQNSPKSTALDHCVSVPSAVLVPSQFASTTDVLSCCLHVLIENLPTSASDPMSPKTGSKKAQEQGTFTLLQEVFIFCVCVSPQSLVQLFSKHFLDNDDTLDFLLPFWTARPTSNGLFCQTVVGQPVPLIVVVNSFHVAHGLLISSSENDKALDLSLLVPGLVVGLTHTSKAVRHAALMCFTRLDNRIDILNSPKDQVKVLKAVLEMLVDVREEFLADEGFVQKFFASRLTGSSLRAETRMELTAFFLNFVGRLYKQNAYAQRAILSAFSGVPSSVMGDSILPILKKMLTKTNKRDAAEPSLDTPSVVQLLFKWLDETTACKPDGFALLNLGLASDLVFATVTGEDIAVRNCALGQLTSQLFGNFLSHQQDEIFGILCANSSSSMVQTVLQTLPLNSSLIIKRLNFDLKTVATQDIPLDKLPTLNGERSSSEPDSDSAESSDDEDMEPADDSLIQLSKLLEVCQFLCESPNFVHRFKLIAVLFKLLGKLLEPSIQNRAVEYPKQLVLTSLLLLVKAYSTFCGKVTKKSSTKDDLSEADIEVSSLVICIAPSQSTEMQNDTAMKSQTRNHALLLLSALGPIVPHQVIGVIEPIFQRLYGPTNDDSKASRDDDSYSFSVVQQTIETVIPPILHTKGLELSVVPLLNIIVNGACIMSSTRGIRLLTVFHTSLQSATDESKPLPLSQLHCSLALLLSKLTTLAVSHRKKEKKQVKELRNLSLRSEETLQESEHCLASLCSHFSLLEQVASLVQLVALIQTPLSADGNSEIAGILAPALKNGYDSEKWRVNTLEFVSLHLRNLVNLVLFQDDDQAADMEVQYLALFEELLISLRMFNERLTDLEGQEGHNHERQFLIRKNDLTHTCLDNLNRLLSVKSFVSVVTKLLEHKASHIRRKALQLLSDQVWANQHTEPENISRFLSVMPSLEKLVISDESAAKRKSTADQTEDRDDNRTKVMALAALEALISVFAGCEEVDSKKQFLAFVRPVIAVVKKRHTQISGRKVTAGALACLGVFADRLSMNFLPHLALSCTSTLEVLENVLKSDDAPPAIVQSGNKRKKRQETVIEQVTEESEEAKLEREREIRSKLELQSAALSALKALVSTLPRFMSPFINRITLALMHPALPDPSDTNASGSMSDVQTMLSVMATEVEARILLPHVFSSVDSALKLGDKSVCRLFWFLSTITQNFNKSTVKNEYKAVFKFLLTGFDFRRFHSDEFKDINSVEKATVEAMLQLVIKLKESQLKGLFLKCLEWVGITAVGAGLGLSGESDMQVQVDKALNRCHVFFLFVEALASKLQGIFVPFFGYLVDQFVLVLQPSPCADLLEESESPNVFKQPKKNSIKQKRNKSDEEAVKTVELRGACVQLVLSSLRKAFVFDHQQFFSKEYFDTVVPPLVAQLENGLAGRTEKAYQEFVDQFLGPALEELAVRMGNYTLWKPLNHAVLNCCRHHSAAVRFASVTVLQRLFCRLAEQWLVMLPETLPSIAELMEDTDTNVESRTQELITDIEKISGESLQSSLG